MSNEAIVDYLSFRLENFEILAKHGVMPGYMDTYEQQQLEGRIKELKRALDFIGDLMRKELALAKESDYNAQLQEMHKK